MKRYVAAAYGATGVLRGFKNANSNIWAHPETEMDFGDGPKLADALVRRGYHVVVDQSETESPTWAVVYNSATPPYKPYHFMCHWTDAYFHPYEPSAYHTTWEDWK